MKDRAHADGAFASARDRAWRRRPTRTAPAIEIAQDRGATDRASLSSAITMRHRDRREEHRPRRRPQGRAAQPPRTHRLGERSRAAATSASTRPIHDASIERVALRARDRRRRERSVVEPRDRRIVARQRAFASWSAQRPVVRVDRAARRVAVREPRCVAPGHRSTICRVALVRGEVARAAQPVGEPERRIGALRASSARRAALARVPRSAAAACPRSSDQLCESPRFARRDRARREHLDAPPCCDRDAGVGHVAHDAVVEAQRARRDRAAGLRMRGRPRTAHRRGRASSARARSPRPPCRARPDRRCRARAAASSCRRARDAHDAASTARIETRRARHLLVDRRCRRCLRRDGCRARAASCAGSCARCRAPARCARCSSRTRRAGCG